VTAGSSPAEGPARRSARLLLPLAALGLGAAGFALLVLTRAPVETRPPAAPPPLVRVVPVQLETVQLEVRTHGTVAPRTENDLVPEVSGRVVWIAPSLVSGGFFEEGEPLLRIDPRDYQAEAERAHATLAQRESELERATRELERRRGLAQREFASARELDDAINAEKVAAAALRVARAALERAERDLARTTLVAPFAGRVREENVDVGQFVARGAPIARLYAVDYAEVRLPVPDEELAFLKLPSLHRGDAPEASGPPVRLHARFAGVEQTWEGRVVRTEGEIDPRTRMVNVVARVEDPYGRRDGGRRPPLAVGLFVEAEILGEVAEGVAVLPRAAMRGSDRVLVVDAESRLRFREVDVLRRTRDRVLIRAGLETGEHVCVSPLDTAVDGMEVRTLVESVTSGEATS
jgi:RND family efflux transporter MFP subunit